MSDHFELGRRFQQWTCYDEPTLAAAQKAKAYEAFAAEFESLPPEREPSDGWGKTMADLCRRIACRHRGEPVDEDLRK